MIQVVTFYSFKGGVGRTMALVNVAVAMARDGKTVAVLDMDLEAPGVGMWMPARAVSPTQQGLLDLIEQSVEEGSIPEDLDPYLYEPQLPQRLKGGRILVMPTGRLDDSYARRIAALDWVSFFEGLGGWSFFERLKTQLENLYGIDVLLVDARTGFSDPGAIAVRALPDLAVLLFRPDAQNISGMKRVLDDIRADAAELQGADLNKNEGDHDVGLRYLLVASPVLRGGPGSETERRQRERLLAAAWELNVLPGVTSGRSRAPETSGLPNQECTDPIEDDPSADIDQIFELIYQIDWQSELANVGVPVVPASGTDTLSLNYIQLSDRILERLKDILRAPGAQKTTKWSPEERQQILEAPLGQLDGESDEQLLDRFVSTETVRKALDLNTTFIIGNKGSGKSAIFRYILFSASSDSAREDLESTESLAIPVHGEVEKLTALGAEDLPTENATEGDYDLFWMSYISARLQRYVETGDPIDSRPLVELQRCHRDRMAQLENVASEYDRLAREAKKKAGARDVLILIDGTERLFADRPFYQGMSARGLARTYLRWRTAFPSVRMKIFLRDQALMERSGTLMDRSHLRGKLVDLAWEEEDAWWFLLRRLLGSLLEKQPPSAVHDGEIWNRLKDSSQPVTGTLDSLRRLMEVIFPAKVYPGENEAPFHRWLLSRMQDGKGAFYPRALLMFAENCQKKEKNKTPVNENRDGPFQIHVFGRETVKDSFVATSEQHGEDYLHEHGYLEPYLRVFKGKVFPTYQVRFTEKELRRAFEDVSSREDVLVTPEAALMLLVHLGVLEHRPESRWRGVHYDYELPAIYKFYLVTPKGRI